MTVAQAYASTVRTGRWLQRRNPLAKLAAVTPAIVALVFVRDLTTPLLFLVAAVAITLAGTRLSGRSAALLLLALPAAVVVLGLGMSLWADPDAVDRSAIAVQVGSWSLYTGAVTAGFATGLRLGAIAALALLAGLSTAGTDLVRATVQNLRMPYRIGYTALAAIRFVPRFGHELDIIRQAHRVRGAHGGRGPFAAIARWWGYLVPLLAGAIRHAERVALAMDARAFGAFPTRTERYVVPWRAADTWFVAIAWVATAGILIFAGR